MTIDLTLLLQVAGVMHLGGGMEHRSGMAIPKSPLVLMTLVLAGALTISLMAEAGPFKGHADLTGFQENPTLSSSATGTADVEISKDGNSVSYTLSYRGFGTNIRFAHIHLGRPAINGSIMVFL